MALHSTRKQSNFQLSLKKHLLDNAGTLPIFFDLLDDIPVDGNEDTYTKWCVVQLGDKVGVDLLEQTVLLHLFTYKDNEGDMLSELQDTVMGIFTNINGALVPFTLYDAATWSSIGGVSVFEQAVSDENDDFNGAKFKTINLLCKWNAI